MLRLLFLLLLLSSCCVAVIANGISECSILTLIDFTAGALVKGPLEPYPSALSLSRAAYSQMAAALLAKRHFNERNPEVVPDLTRYVNCSVMVPEATWWVDSQFDPTVPLQALIDIGSCCSLVGPFLTRAVEGASALSQSLSIPLLTAAHNERLSNRNNYPSVVRVGGELKWFAMSVAEYLQAPERARDFVAILADSEDYGEQFEDPLEDHGEDELGMETTSEFLSDEDSVQDGLLEVLRKGFHTIVLVSDRPSFLRVVAQKAHDLNMIGPEWLYLISGETLTPEILESLKEVAGSPLDRLLQGAAIFADYDPFLMNDSVNEPDPFLQSWKRQGRDLVEAVNSYHPLLNNNKTSYDKNKIFQGSSTYFQDFDPSRKSSFIYDSIILTGMAACQVEANRRRVNESEKTPQLTISEILSMDFQGASGQVRFQTEYDGTKTNSRDPNGMAFGMLNVRPYHDIQDDTGIRKYNSVLTAIYREGEWHDVPNEKFIFYDGTSNQPMPLVTTVDFHYLKEGVLVVGRMTVALSLFITIATGSWVCFQRANSAVKMSQPEFLILMCFGSFLVSLSSIFHSFDEKQGKSEKELTRLCSVTPWLFVGGYLTIYCAIFAKFWRLVKLMSLRRAKITVQRALWPFCLFLPTSLGILTCWQVMDPLAWKRVVVNEEPFETAGYCRSENAAPFLIPLGILIVTVTCMTQYVAWKCRRFQEELAEVKWVFYGTMSHLQTWIIFLPIMVALGDTSPSTTYMMFSLLTLLFSTTMVTLVIWPKIYTVHFSLQFDGSSRHINVMDSSMCTISGVGDRVRMTTSSGIGRDSTKRDRSRSRSPMPQKGVAPPPPQTTRASYKLSEQEVDGRTRTTRFSNESSLCHRVVAEAEVSSLKKPPLSPKDVARSLSRTTNIDNSPPVQVEKYSDEIPDPKEIRNSLSEVLNPESFLQESTKATPDPMMPSEPPEVKDEQHDSLTEVTADQDSECFINELLELERRGAV